MPDRILREAVWASPKFNALANDAHRLLFLRLISKCVDDFGCFDGRIEVIANTAYPLGGPVFGHPSGEDERLFSSALDDLQRVGLIIRYSNAGRPFVGIPQWSHDYRFRRRFPAPPINLDVREIVYRGKYGKKIDWRNPEGFDDVSLLLDADGRAAAPQPPEWRRISSDWAPVTATVSDYRAVTVGKPSVTAVQSLSAAPQSLHTSVRPLLDDLKTLRLPTSATPTTTATKGEEPPVTAPQSLPSASKQNGAIELMDSGEWHGVSEAQRLKWQSMFDSLSIPDQLDRAAQWLLSHPEKRSEYSSVEGGLQSYLVNWLLREARGAPKH